MEIINQQCTRKTQENPVTQNGNKPKGNQRTGGGAGQLSRSDNNRGSPSEAGDLGEPRFPARVISFDVGIKNMAYCIFDVSNSDDILNGTTIIDWATLNLLHTQVSTNVSTNVSIPNCTCLKQTKTKKTTDPARQYPPGTQENYGSFSSIIPITQNGKKLDKYCPKGGRGSKGEPGVPPNPACSSRAKYRKGDQFYCEKHAKANTEYCLPSKLWKPATLVKKKVDDLLALCNTWSITFEGKPIKRTILEKMSDFYDKKIFEPILVEKAKTAGETDLITIGRNMTAQLNLTIGPYLSTITHVIIENQISTLANRMKTIQGMLAQFFILQAPTASIEFVSSKNKLKAFEKTKNTQVVDLSNNVVVVGMGEKYKQHKSDGITYTRQLLTKYPNLTIKNDTNNNNNNVISWLITLDQSNKKDDLADAFLQGVWYLQSQNGKII